MTTNKRSPWVWIPTLYFAEGIPNILVTFLACFMYKRLGLSNTDAVLYTSWLYLPWVIKPFWSPVVEMFRTKRWWILITQVLLGASMAGVAFTVPVSGFVQWTLWFFWLMAFSSATHDIAADGFYMLALSERDQSFYVGVRSTFYRVATIAGQGLLTMFAGMLEVFFRTPVKAWSYTFLLAAVLFAALSLWHAFFLPRPQADANHMRPEDAAAKASARDALREFIHTFVAFFRKPGLGVALMFMLLYRLPEALLTKICPLFYVDAVDKGGLGLSTGQIGFLQGAVGVAGLLLGGIVGGAFVARWGLRRLLWPMALSITVPDVVYVVLAYFQLQDFLLTGALVFFEQWGYGFGFTAYMIFLMRFSQGPLQTAHYAFCTGVMALSMMLPGLFAGALEEAVGYLNYFLLVMALTPLTFVAAAMVVNDLKVES